MWATCTWDSPTPAHIKEILRNFKLLFTQTGRCGRRGATRVARGAFVFHSAFFGSLAAPEAAATAPGASGHPAQHVGERVHPPLLRTIPVVVAQ